MKISHIMADGKVLDDITGKVVKIGEAKDLYGVLNKKRSVTNETEKSSLRSDPLTES